MKNKTEVINAICREISIRKDYLEHNCFDSLYFGGGTPAILSEAEIERIFAAVRETFTIKRNAEITIEANPEDLNPCKLSFLKSLGFNRLSLGVQSFIDDELAFLGRNHDSKIAFNAIELAQNAGFSNLTIDLIYGIPGSSLDNLSSNLEQIYKLAIPHFSAYALTLESKTPFFVKIKKGLMPAPDEELAAEQFLYLHRWSGKHAYAHYEISNFCKNGFISRHNSNYWNHETYIGIGPSAHSFDGNSRQWNIQPNMAYVNAVMKGEAYFEKEILSRIDIINEIIMLGLRTKWGVPRQKIAEIMSREETELFERKFNKYQLMGFAQLKDDAYTLTPQGMLLSDRILSELFME